MHICRVIKNRGLINRNIISSSNIKLIHKDLISNFSVGPVNNQKVSYKTVYMCCSICCYIVVYTISSPDFCIKIKIVLTIYWMRLQANQQRDNRYFMCNIDCWNSKSKYPWRNSSAYPRTHICWIRNWKVINFDLTEDLINSNVRSSKISPWAGWDC